MTCEFKALAAGFGLVLAASAAQAEVAEMKPMTEAMVVEAEEYFQEAPLDEVRQAFNDPESDRWMGDRYHLHMMGMTADGEVWANATFPDLVGMDGRDMADFDGRYFFQDIIEATEGNSDLYGIQIRFSNPESGDIVDAYGSCLRPAPEHIICAWADGES